MKQRNMKTQSFISYFLVGLLILLFESCQDKQTKIDLQKYQQSQEIAAQNSEIVKHSFELLDELNLEAYNELLESDHKVYMGSSKEPIKFSDISPFIQTVYKSFPDYKHAIKNIISTEDYVVAQIQLSGTHTNTYQEVDPTGNRIDYSGVFIFKMGDSRISEIWVLEDNIARDSQLGFSL